MLFIYRKEEKRHVFRHEEQLPMISYESCEQMWTNAIPYEDVYVAESNEGLIVGFSKGGKESIGCRSILLFILKHLFN